MAERGIVCRSAERDVFADVAYPQKFV